MLATFCLLAYKFETFCGVSIHHLAAMDQKEKLIKIKKKGFFGTPYWSSRFLIFPHRVRSRAVTRWWCLQSRSRRNIASSNLRGIVGWSPSWCLTSPPRRSELLYFLEHLWIWDHFAIFLALRCATQSQRRSACWSWSTRTRWRSRSSWSGAQRRSQRCELISDGRKMSTYNCKWFPNRFQAMELPLLTVMVHQDRRLQDTCLPGCNLVSQLQRKEPL